MSFMANRPLRHPDIESVTVADILHALADPVRLAIVSELRDTESEMSCVETMNKAEVALPKSTCSQHFQILREAGLIQCERKGVELSSRLRARELDARFPGLLASILRAYRQEKKKAARTR
jgi:DNA-binding transcriptional ArsR family regulator